MSAMLFKGRNRVTQAFGGSGSHTGIDIVGDDNTTVYATQAGTVETVHYWDGHTTSQASDESYGNYVVVKMSNGYRCRYAHLASMAVSVGQSVSVGTKIGVMGSTGNTTGAHTHFEMRTGTGTGTRINPAPYCGVENKCGTYYSDSSSSGSSSGTLATDGIWGSKTTLALQKYLGTTQDGIISDQWKKYKSDNPGLEDSSWEWKDSPTKYSQCLLALQKKIGLSWDDGGNGWWGPITCRKLQTYLGTTVDGKISNPSQAVKKMQERLNAGNL